jgi:hypothetical protein
MFIAGHRKPYPDFIAGVMQTEGGRLKVKALSSGKNPYPRGEKTPTPFHLLLIDVAWMLADWLWPLLIAVAIVVFTMARGLYG